MKYVKEALFAAGLLGVAAFATTPANAILQVAISDGVNTFTCFDGQGSCDFGGGQNDLLTLQTNVGAFNIRGTLSTAVQGAGNLLDFSTLQLTNTGSTTGNLTLVVSQTNYFGPISQITESASLTFGNNFGATASTLSFYADHNNGQGAGAGLATPGDLLFSVSGVPFANPSSFSGTNPSLFFDANMFSMTEKATLNMLAGSFVTGFDMSMATPQALEAVPEPGTWAMMVLGFAGIGLYARKRQKGSSASLRLA